MANPYYEFLSPVLAGTVVRSDKYNSDKQGVEAGFEGVNVKLNQKLELPDGYASFKLPSITEDSLPLLGLGGVSLFPASVIYEVRDAVPQVQQWRDEALSYRNATAGYAATVGVPTKLQDGDVLNIPEGQFYMEVVCLGSATINLPAAPGNDAKYEVTSTSTSSSVEINTNIGNNDHNIEIENIIFTSLLLTGKAKVELHWSADHYNGVSL